MNKYFVAFMSAIRNRKITTIPENFNHELPMMH